MAQSTCDGSRVEWPDSKRFAFTVIDDTDGATTENTAPVYELLAECGFRTTKTAWPLATPDAPAWRGMTCEDRAYLDWVKRLQSDGFEIGYHGASCMSSTRERTEEGIRRFQELFGHGPDVCANHYDNKESIYWGEARLTGPARWVYLLLTRFKTHGQSQGHVEGSPYFWGDLCRDHVEYVRNFVFADINTLAKCPRMPYTDRRRPYVRSWFASSDAANADSFCRLLRSENQAKLEREGGGCIVYTHFARGFFDGRNLRPDFCSQMKELAARNGWFVPAGELLRFLEARNGGVTELSNSERRGLEWSWLRDKLVLGKT
jgi:hypothetical protein